MTCLPPPPDVPYGDPGPSLWIRLLTRARDSRRVWDIMGSLYNQAIYDVIAELYDEIARELTVPQKSHILDVGAGRGYLSLLLAVKHPDSHVIGIDYSIRQVRAAQKYREQRKVENCSFAQGNAMDLKFACETFAAAVSVGSIKHWPDAERGLAEIHRVLAPGSCLVIAETDREATDEVLRDFVKRFRLRFVPDWLHFWGLRHVVFGQSFSEQDLACAVARAGFRDIECRRVPSCPYVIVKAWK